MDRNYIDVNLPNVITITLINLFGAVVIGFALKLYKQSQSASAEG